MSLPETSDGGWVLDVLDAIEPDSSGPGFFRMRSRRSGQQMGFWQRSRQFLDGRGLDHRAVDQASAQLGSSYLCEPCKMGRHGLFLKTGTHGICPAGDHRSTVSRLPRTLNAWLADPASPHALHVVSRTTLRQPWHILRITLSCTNNKVDPQSTVRGRAWSWMTSDERRAATIVPKPFPVFRRPHRPNGWYVLLT